MDIFFTVTYYLFIIHLVRTIIYWLNLWQMKEYRLDRLLVHIRETSQGRSIVLGIEPVAKTAIIFLYFFTIFYSQYYDLVPYSVFGIYAYEAAKFIIDIFQKKIKLPIFTPKLVVIGISSASLILLFLLVPLLDKFFWLVFIDKFLIWIIALLMGIFSFPSMFYKDTQINKAITKLRRHKKVLVIGITGSYGKGSTKEYMHTILSTKFNAIKTHSTHNTPIGIARTILTKLNKKTEIFIVEMGAYKIGEIAEMCEFVQPSIGVLTAVNDQHVSLFGSIENTKQAKYEIIDSLSSKGIGLFNGNNKIVAELFKGTRRRHKYLYYSGDDAGVNVSINAVNIQVYPTYITFDANVLKQEYKRLRVDLIGAHNIENILPGIFVAQLKKMTKSEITEGLRLIKPLYKTMEPFRSNNGAIFVDDTFNANPASVLSAVEYLKHQKGKKALVLQPMIELGKNGKEEHYKIAIEIGKICDYLLITNSNFYKEINRGVRDSGGDCQIISDSPKNLSILIRQNFGKNDVVVFEGKEAQAVLDLIPHSAIHTDS